MGNVDSTWRRPPAVAGTFYPSAPARLREMLEGFLKTDEAAHPEPAIGVFVPHAGYIYSGSCAGKTFNRVKIPPSVIILAVNHHVPASHPAIWPKGEWETPLGEVEVDAELSDRIRGAAGDMLTIDRKPHLFEHSLEVQLPFLQVLRPEVNIVPIVLSGMDADRIRRLGSAIAEAVRSYGAAECPLVVASGDMSHQVAADEAKRLDRFAMDALEALDPVGFFESRAKYGIPMCGHATGGVMLQAAKESGATKAEIVEWTHSGVATGDEYSVVSYLGAVVK